MSWWRPNHAVFLSCFAQMAEKSIIGALILCKTAMFKVNDVNQGVVDANHTLIQIFMWTIL